MHKVTIKQGAPYVAIAQLNLEIGRVYKYRNIQRARESLVFVKRCGNVYSFFDYKTLESCQFHGGDVIAETSRYLTEIIIE